MAGSDQLLILTHRGQRYRLWRVAKDGSAAPAAVDDIDAAALSLVEDSSGLFLAMGVVVNQAAGGGDFRRAAYGRVMTEPRGGGSRTMLYEGFRAVRELAVDATHAYWLTGFADTAGTVRLDAVMRAPKAGGAAAFVATSVHDARALAVAGGVAYVSADASIVRVGGPGQRPRAIATGVAPRAVDLGVDGNYLYFRSGDDVKRLGLGGGAATTIARGAKRYVIDGDRLYYATENGVSVRAKDGSGDASPLRVGSSAAIAVDADWLYVASSDAVVRLAKHTE